MKSKAWRVGALARAAGLTVRALHHYDSIGLLRPSARTQAGHRLYTEADVGRLYRVLALRQLGLSLDQTAAALDGDEGDLKTIVRAQLGHVERQLEHQTGLRARLRSVLSALERSEPLSADTLIELLEAMKMFERYYTPEQLAQLEQRRQLLGDDAIRRVEEEWPVLIAEVEAARREGADPTSERVQALAGRWKDLVAQFTGGDQGIGQSLRRMYETEGVETASRGMINPELMEYIGKAISAAGGW
jgi:MerR family transcriptional regulator, thiopeptide resistance regulator